MAEHGASTIRPMGEGARLLTLGDPGPEISAQARALARAIRGAAWPGVYDCVPAYCSVLVRFDPCQSDSAAIDTALLDLLRTLEVAAGDTGKLVELPIRYGGEDGPDLQDVAAHTGLKAEEVIRLHSEACYRVEFLGFSPGFPYLSGLPPALATPRLATPRTRVPAGSVGIGGLQAGFYPLPSPGGWRLIGRIPDFHFDPAHPETLPYAPGDTIRFVPIVPSRARSSRAAPQPVTVTSSRSVPPAVRHLRVVRAGLQTTVQDLGRMGLASVGYATAGALDQQALRIANRLVGNDPGVAALEITVDGGEFEAEGDLVIAVTGADLAPAIDGEPLTLWRAAALRDGARLSFAARQRGMRAYLAVAGGIATPDVLGSRSTDLIAGLGGMGGRAVQAGDRIPIAAPGGHVTGYALDPAHIPAFPETVEARVVWGPQDDWFDEAARTAFTECLFRVSPRSDRTALRLEGTPIAPITRDLTSEGCVPGAIQVPADGGPIVLLADSRGVGGYPKIATVIEADRDLLAQAAPGTQIRFQAITEPDARQISCRRRAQIDSLPLRKVPELAVRCLRELGAEQPAERCPRSLACLVSARCLAPTIVAQSERIGNPGLQAGEAHLPC